MRDVQGACLLSLRNQSYLRALVAFRSRWTRRTDSGVKASTVPSPVRRQCRSSLCPASCSFCPSSSTWAASFTRNKRNASSYTVSSQLHSSIVTRRDLVFEGWGLSCLFWGGCKARVHPLGGFICSCFRCYGYWTLFLCCKTESLLRIEVSTFVESSPLLRQMHELLNFGDYSVFMLACSSFSLILRFIEAYFPLQDSERMGLIVLLFVFRIFPRVLCNIFPFKCRCSQTGQVLQQSDEHPGQTELRRRTGAGRTRSCGRSKVEDLTQSPQSSNVGDADPVRVLWGFVKNKDTNQWLPGGAWMFLTCTAKNWTTFITARPTSQFHHQVFCLLCDPLMVLRLLLSQLIINLELARKGEQSAPNYGLRNGFPVSRVCPQKLQKETTWCPLVVTCICCKGGGKKTQRI